MGQYIVSHIGLPPQLTRRHPQSPPIQHLTIYQLFLGHGRTFPRLHIHKQRSLERLLLREPTGLTPSPSWIHEKRASACGTRPSIRGWLPPPDHTIPPHAACDTWREGSNRPRASTRGERPCRGRPRCDWECIVGAARKTPSARGGKKSWLGECQFPQCAGHTRPLNILISLCLCMRKSLGVVYVSMRLAHPQKYL
jgi:hypothetical protein